MPRNFRGYPCSDELAEWLTWYQRVCLDEGVIKKNLDVYQLQGTYTKSGNTHIDGYAFDIAQCDGDALWIADQMGSFSWRRTPKQGFIYHQHGGLYGIPKMNAALAGQGRDRKAGWNGLVGRSRARDRRPVSGRTWDQGVRWAKERLGEKVEHKPTYYPVAAGDNLTAIAKRFGVTVDQLVAWNGIQYPNFISVGQRLRVSA